MAKDLPFVCPIDLGCFGEVGRDVSQTGKIDHRVVTDKSPNGKNDDDRKSQTGTGEPIGEQGAEVFGEPGSWVRYCRLLWLASAMGPRTLPAWLISPPSWNRLYMPGGPSKTLLRLPLGGMDFIKQGTAN